MSESSKKISVFFTELSKAIDKLGIDEVIKILDHKSRKSVEISDNNIAFVVNLVCDHYNIPFETVISEKDKSIKRMLVMAFCVYYLNKYFKYSLDDLKFLFGRSKSQLSRLKKKWVEDELKNKKGTIYQSLQVLDIQVKSYIKNN